MAGKRKGPTSSAGRSTAGKPTARKRTTGKNGRPRRPRTPQQRVLLGLKWAGIAFLVLALIGAGGFVVLYNAIDVPSANTDFKTETTKVFYDDDGGKEKKEEIGKFAIQDREILQYAEIPQNIKDAVVAAENRSFWSDNGIDVKGIVRAALNNASGGTTEGASTITQQLVKILYLNQEQTYTRKVKEAILALKIQRQMSKQEVLTDYLNTIYFGRGAYGVQAASQAYFGIDAKKLNLRQAAVLASVLNDPNDLDPRNGREAREDLLSRYRYVIRSMADVGDITAEQAEKVSRRLPKFARVKADNNFGGQDGFMLTMVRQELLRLGFDEDQIDGGGLRVETTFRRADMVAAEEGVKEGRPEGFGDKFLHVGVGMVEPGTGAVRGFYGGQDFLQSQLNWAVRGGQAGSTFKPFALAAALKEGYSLQSTFDGNSPLVLDDGTDVENQGDRDYGSRVSLLKATEDSINTAYVDLTRSLENGMDSVIETANLMGIPPAKPTRKSRGFPNHTPGLDQQGLLVALGAQTVSPINMANAYATIANGGVAAEPYIIERVTSADGEVLYEHEVITRKAMDERRASDVSHAMQQVVKSGSGTAALALDRPAAGKTGTATNALGQVSSAWFAGFTPQLATAVMYVRGKGNGQLDGWLPSYFGGAYPAGTWTAIMTRAMEGLPVEEFPEPALLKENDPPSDEHAPYTPPPPKKTKKTKETSEPPSTEPTRPSQSTEPTEPTDPTGPTGPTGPTTPTQDCFLNPNDCESEGPGNGGDGGGGQGRDVAATRETAAGRPA